VWYGVTREQAHSSELFGNLGFLLGLACPLFCLSTHSLCLVQEVALVTVCAVFGLVLIQCCGILFGVVPLLSMIPIVLMPFMLMFSLVYGYYEA